MAAPQKLAHLLQLADQGPALRAALAEEVAELLTHWPADYPRKHARRLRGLLAKAARDVDQPTRARCGCSFIPIRNWRIACCRANPRASRW